MRAGRLDRLITIQRKSVSQSSSGMPVESWTALGPVQRAAQMTPVRGDERLASPGLVSTEQIEFLIRYSSEVADLSPKDRIIHPALDVDEDPVNDLDRAIHDIVAVHEIGRREGLQIIAIRRPGA